MGDDRFFFCSPSLPAVQFHTATTRQKHLAIHLNRGVSSQLASYKIPEKQTQESHESSKIVNAGFLKRLLSNGKTKLLRGAAVILSFSSTSKDCGTSPHGIMGWGRQERRRKELQQ
jgi:hypothetical protein